ncbi:DUF1761 domain-containing protein [Aquabacterium sp. OR-4]|uniref:DUF1761 domain-containing protein n=1 Tax=Aquabacterium sp. OR-4 TaxID=2978127 RepID=UPI0021B3371C|nr:DUF1761 domain-containing protein [Aquabacterium sp. OR-4]MDT7835423.1 DUF1761 domain-containing protein [Aquabacterium sp. OR-4]
MPIINPNPLAIAAAALAIFMISYVWYTPLFGRQWAQEMGLPPDHSPGGAALARGLVLTAVGALLMSMVLANSMAVWHPKAWGLTVPGPGAAEQVLSASGFSWLGFVLPVLLHRLAWEKFSLRLLAINGGYYLVSLLAAALVLRLMA